MNYNERLYRQRHGYECSYDAAVYAALIIIAATGTTATIQGANATAKAQENYQTETTKASNQVAALNMAQVRAAEAQDREAHAREDEKARLLSQREASTAAVAAGEAGVTGGSVEALLQEYQTQLGQFREATARQASLQQGAFDAQIEGLRLGAGFSNAQINAPISGPNYAAIGAQFAGQVLGATRDYKSGSLNFGGRPKKTGGVT